MTYVDGLLSSLTRVKKARSLRTSSWDTTGRNNDAWNIAPGETRVLADIQGPGCINHIWMTQPNGYRNVLIQMFWDDMDLVYSQTKSGVSLDIQKGTSNLQSSLPNRKE